jgi:hypothetical protein
MATNKARFTINGLPSEDVNGNPGIDVTAGAALVIQLEANPALGVSSVEYSINDPDDDETPLCSLNSTNQVFVENGEAKITLSNPNQAVNITVNVATQISSYVIRAKATTIEGVYYYERIVSVRSNGLRMTVPGETTQYARRGWNDTLNELTLAMANADLEGGVTRLSRILYVDGGTASTSQDGSIGDPFLTIDQANAIVNAGAANSSWVILLTPGYSYTVSAYPTARQVVYAVQNATPNTLDTFTDTSIGGTSTVGTNHHLTFVGVSVSSIGVTGAGVIYAHHCRLGTCTRSSGTAGQASIIAHNTVFDILAYGAGDQALAFNVEAYGCTFRNTTSVYTFHVYNCTITGNVDARSTVSIHDCRFTTNSTLNTNNTTGVNTFYMDEASRVSADEFLVIYSQHNTSFTGRVGTKNVVTYRFNGENLVAANSALWAANTPATIADHASLPFKVATFNGTTDSSVGLMFPIPDGKRYITFEVWYGRATGSAGGNFVLATQRKQLQGNGADPSTWSSQAVAITLAAPTTATRWQRFRQRVALSTLSMEDRSYQLVQLTRVPANAGDTITDDLVIREIIVELT